MVIWCAPVTDHVNVYTVASPSGQPVLVIRQLHPKHSTYTYIYMHFILMSLMLSYTVLLAPTGTTEFMDRAALLQAPNEFKRLFFLLYFLFHRFIYYKY